MTCEALRVRIPNIDEALVDALCGPDINQNSLLFNAAVESKEFLQTWLTYRGFSQDQLKGMNQREYAILTKDNMVQNGNYPSIKDFVDFSVQSAGLGFLEKWMSWFGVTSEKSRPAQWWRHKARRLQKMKIAYNTLTVITITSPKKSIIATQQADAILREIVEAIQCVGVGMIAQQNTKHTLPQQKENTPPTPQTTITQMRSTVTSKLNSKRILAYILDTAMIAGPILYLGVHHRKQIINKIKGVSKKQFGATAVDVALHEVMPGTAAHVISSEVLQKSVRGQGVDISKVMLMIGLARVTGSPMVTQLVSDLLAPALKSN